MFQRPHTTYKSLAKFLNFAICFIFILSTTRTVVADPPVLPYHNYLPVIQNGSWSNGFVDSPKYFGDLGTRAIQYDSNENPCIVYGNDHLYYACVDTARTNWTYTTVDNTAGVGRYATLVLDAADHPHIAYFDETNGMLRYAYWDGATWTIDYVDGAIQSARVDAGSFVSEEDAKSAAIEDAPQSDPAIDEDKQGGLISHKQGVGGFPSLAVDAQNQPHIAYYDFRTFDLKYAVKTGGVWHAETVDSAGDVGTYPSLAITSNGAPMIAYYDATYGKLKLATKGASTWSKLTLDGSNSSDDNVGLYASLVLNSADEPRIAYYNSSAHTLKYWRNNESVTLGTNMGMFASLRLHPDGRPYITYFNEADQNLAMIYVALASQGGGWVNVQLDPGDFVGRMGSLAISKTSGWVGAVYYNSSSSELSFAEKKSSTIKRLLIDTSTITGFYASLAFAGTQPRIAYLNDSQNKLMYAYLENKVWKVEDITAMNSTGVQPSLAVSQAGVSHLIYRQTEGSTSQGTTNSLRYIFRSGSSWSQPVIVDQGVNIGDYSFLAVNGSGNPYTSYYDGYNKDLKYGRMVNGNWSVSTIDSDGDVGKYSSIALDSLSLPWISYYDDSNDNLKVAHKTISGAWQIWTVASSGTIGTYSNIAVSPTTSAVYVVYRDETNNTLKVSTYNGSTWSAEVLASGGSENSIVVSKTGAVVVSYYDTNTYSLKLAFKANGLWRTETADQLGDVGRFNSLACTENICAVGYMDATNGDLKYAVRNSNP